MEKENKVLDENKKPEIGRLVAYKNPNTGNLTTGKIKDVIFENDEVMILKVEDVTRKIFYVNYTNILWFKGRKWPRFIYNELKGITK